jgi:hypothetical protein
VAVHVATGDLDRLPVDERVRHGAPGLGQNSRERGAGDPHPAGGLGVIQLLQVGQSQRLQAVKGQGVLR